MRLSIPVFHVITALLHSAIGKFVADVSHTALAAPRGNLGRQETLVFDILARIHSLSQHVDSLQVVLLAEGNTYDSYCIRCMSWLITNI